MQDPNADTEWNDILRAKGILPPRPGPTEEEIADEMDRAIAAAQDKHLEKKQLDELDELEDEEDERVLMEYRRMRIAEMKAQAMREKYGEVIHISEPEFVKEVSEASKDDWVVVHLYRDDLPHCRLVNSYLNTLSKKYKSTKFVKIIGNQCIPNYPDRNLPTLLVYGEGDIKAQVVGLAQLGGERGGIQAVENFLASVGAIKIDDRLDTPKQSTERTIYASTSRDSDEEEEDDDD